MFCFHGNKKEKQCGSIRAAVGKVVFNNILGDVLYAKSVTKPKESTVNNNN